MPTDIANTFPGFAKHHLRLGVHILISTRSPNFKPHITWTQFARQPYMDAITYQCTQQHSIATIRYSYHLYHSTPPIPLETTHTTTTQYSIAPIRLDSPYTTPPCRSFSIEIFNRRASLSQKLL